LSTPIQNMPSACKFWLQDLIWDICVSCKAIQFIMIAVSLFPHSPFSPVAGFIKSLCICNSTSLGLSGAFV